MKIITLLILALTVNCAKALAQQHQNPNHDACAFEDDSFVQSVIFQVREGRIYSVPRTGTVATALQTCQSDGHDECVTRLTRPARAVERSCWLMPTCYASGGRAPRIIPAQYRVVGLNYEPKDSEEVCQTLSACRAITTENPERSAAIERLHGFYCAR